MKLELAEHLKKVRGTVNEVDRILGVPKYANDPLSVMVIGLLSTIIQHHRSIVVLVSSGSVRAALIRDIG
jgi:hypothetical protein